MGPNKRHRDEKGQAQIFLDRLLQAFGKPGSHFTHPADIMKIVGPTIVEPWREHLSKKYDQ